MTDLTNPIFHDEKAARGHLEKIRWPDGPVCPHCGSVNRSTRLKGKTTRPGLFQCNDCRGHYSVTVGSVMERSHIPLTKWVLGFHLMAASKKGVSAHQLHRMLGITYKSAWFMAHRIREAMGLPAKADPIGGKGKTVEIDETFVGGKAKNRAYKKPPKKTPVVGLVERDGNVRTFVVADVNSKNLRSIVVTVASRESHIMTDEALYYTAMGKEFAGHSTVNHSADEYVRLGSFAHTNTIEGVFSLLKRGVVGTFHHVSEAHLPRYLAEFDFRYNARKISDAERAALAMKGAEGKRLMYHQPREATNA